MLEDLSLKAAHVVWMFINKSHSDVILLSGLKTEHKAFFFEALLLSLGASEFVESKIPESGNICE